MKAWLVILGFACAQAVTAAVWTPALAAPADQNDKCCCCTAGECSCGCEAAPADDSSPETPRPARFCSCDDQPVPVPRSDRVEVRSLSEQFSRVAVVDANQADSTSHTLEPHPRVHGPPPHLVLVNTIILLS